MKAPGPDHPIAIAPSGQRVRVLFNGAAVADTTRALMLAEAAYKPVFYIPRGDAQLALLTKTAHGTHCPYKGEASYYTIRVGDRVSENAIWSYEQPYSRGGRDRRPPRVYPNRVDAIEVTAVSAAAAGVHCCALSRKRQRAQTQPPHLPAA